MKYMVKIVIMTCLLSLNFAQEKGNGFGFTFNGGSSIMNLMMMGEGTITPTVYYIYNLSNASIEPSLGYYSISNDGESSSITTVGVGYLKNRTESDSFGTYWGGRFSMSMISDADDTAISISPVCGAEYSFSNNFSVGGETRFNYGMSGDTNIMNISTHLFFRFYK